MMKKRCRSVRTQSHRRARKWAYSATLRPTHPRRPAAFPRRAASACRQAAEELHLSGNFARSHDVAGRAHLRTAAAAPDDIANRNAGSFRSERIQTPAFPLPRCHGLTAAEVVRRPSLFGANELPNASSRHFVRISSMSARSGVPALALAAMIYLIFSGVGEETLTAASQAYRTCLPPCRIGATNMRNRCDRSMARCAHQQRLDRVK